MAATTATTLNQLSRNELQRALLERFELSFSDDVMESFYVEGMPGLRAEENNVVQFSGYLNVSSTKRSFFVLVLSQDKPKEDPLVLWTNGGPGCSGLIGYLSEHGPWRAQEDLTLKQDDYSWSKVANMLYIESPTGVGYSYSTAGDSAESTDDYKAGDSSVARDNLELVKAFYEKFDTFSTDGNANDFYLSAESYGGHYIPTLAKIMVEDNEDDSVKDLFKGFLVGNPYTDPVENMRGMFGAFWGQQLVPAPMYKSWIDSCGDSNSVNTYYDDEYCATLEDDMFDIVGDVDWYGLGYPVCNRDLSTDVAAHDASDAAVAPPGSTVYASKQEATLGSGFNQVLSSQAAQMLKHTHPRLHQRVAERWEQLKSGGASAVGGNYHGVARFSASSEDEGDATQAALGYDACVVDYMTQYLNKPEVKAALHADSSATWSECSASVLYDYSCQLDYMETLYKQFLETTDLRIMVFSGDDDSICAPLGTQNWIWKLGYDVIDKWAAWYYKSDYGSGQVGGYHVKFNGTSGSSLTFVTAHDAGHEVSMYQPLKGFMLFKNFVKGIW